jgi:hypothetical protein
MKDAEIARMRMEEKETSRKEMEQMRREVSCCQPPSPPDPTPHHPPTPHPRPPKKEKKRKRNYKEN